MVSNSVRRIVKTIPHRRDLILRVSSKILNIGRTDRATSEDQDLLLTFGIVNLMCLSGIRIERGKVLLEHSQQTKESNYEIK